MELRLEILGGVGLNRADYRFGDLTCSWLGLKEAWPYVVVEFQGQTWTTPPTKAEDDFTALRLKTVVDLSDGEPDSQLTFRVYHKKSRLQKGILFDPLVGTATLRLKDLLRVVATMRAFRRKEPVVATMELQNGISEVCSSLSIRYTLIDSTGLQEQIRNLDMQITRMSHTLQASSVVSSWKKVTQSILGIRIRPRYEKMESGPRCKRLGSMN